MKIFSNRKERLPRNRMPMLHSLDTTLPLWQTDTVVDSGEPDLVRLAQLLRRHAPYDGRFALRIPGLHAIRMARADAKLVHTIYHRSVCIAAQGAKRMLLGQDVYAYDASHMLVVSVDLPVAAQVTHASHAEPFLCFR